ncbi:MAG: small multi-drug export protein [Reichenbachiella sp.]
MWELIIKYITVYLSSAIKFVVGPLLGVSYGLSIVEIVVLNVLGMMTAVFVITYFGEWIRHQSQRLLKRKKRNVFSKKSRKYVQIWQKFGTPGIAFFTPVLFMPIGGALLANAFGCKKRDIFLYMLVSFLFWSIGFTLVLQYAAHWVPFLDVSPK